MTKLSPEQVYALAIQAGFSPAGATTLTAIAGAESGYDDQNIGDVSLENATYGPSVGLFQIRTEKAQTGTGGYRDATWLAQSDLNQAKAAYSISSGGTNWGPWSTYKDGSYVQFLSGAKSAAAKIGTNVGNLLAPIGNVATGAVDSIVTPLLEGGKKLIFSVSFATIGGLLIIGGAYFLAKPGIKRANEKVLETGKVAVKAVI